MPLRRPRECQETGWEVAFAMIGGMAPRLSLTGTDRRTPRRRSGDTAEAAVADELRRQGWIILARQLRLGRDELDILALDPGPPSTIAVVEVRSRRTNTFGMPEERTDDAKVRRLYRAMNHLRAHRHLLDGVTLPPGVGWRVDLVALDRDTGHMRHLRGLIPR